MKLFWIFPAIFAQLILISTTTATLTVYVTVPGHLPPHHLVMLNSSMAANHTQQGPSPPGLVPRNNFTYSFESPKIPLNTKSPLASTSTSSVPLFVGSTPATRHLKQVEPTTKRGKSQGETMAPSVTEMPPSGISSELMHPVVISETSELVDTVLISMTTVAASTVPRATSMDTETDLSSQKDAHSGRFPQSNESAESTESVGSILSTRSTLAAETRQTSEPDSRGSIGPVVEPLQPPSAPSLVTPTDSSSSSPLGPPAPPASPPASSPVGSTISQPTGNRSPSPEPTTLPKDPYISTSSAIAECLSPEMTSTVLTTLPLELSSTAEEKLILKEPSTNQKEPFSLSIQSVLVPLSQAPSPSVNSSSTFFSVVITMVPPSSNYSGEFPFNGSHFSIIPSNTIYPVFSNTTIFNSSNSSNSSNSLMYSHFSDSSPTDSVSTACKTSSGALILPTRSRPPVQTRKGLVSGSPTPCLPWVISVAMGIVLVLLP